MPQFIAVGGAMAAAAATGRGTARAPPDPQFISSEVDALLRQMRDDEKVALLSGRTMWSAGGVPRLGLPPVFFSDGPHGARGCSMRGTDGAALAPCELALAATFDEALIEEVGVLLGEECKGVVPMSSWGHA